MIILHVLIFPISLTTFPQQTLTNSQLYHHMWSHFYNINYLYSCMRRQNSTNTKASLHTCPPKSLNYVMYSVL